MICFNFKISILNFIGIFKGTYHDFSVEWYRKIGASMSMTLLLSTVVPHAEKVTKPFIVGLKRCMDRGCKSSYHPEDGSYGLRTKKVL
jgi:hypothetical protein